MRTRAAVRSRQPDTDHALPTKEELLRNDLAKLDDFITQTAVKLESLKQIREPTSKNRLQIALCEEQLVEVAEHKELCETLLKQCTSAHAERLVQGSKGLQQCTASHGGKLVQDSKEATKKCSAAEQTAVAEDVLRIQLEQKKYTHCDKSDPRVQTSCCKVLEWLSSTNAAMPHDAAECLAATEKYTERGFPACVVQAGFGHDQQSSYASETGSSASQHTIVQTGIYRSTSPRMRLPHVRQFVGKLAAGAKHSARDFEMLLKGAGFSNLPYLSQGPKLQTQWQYCPLHADLPRLGRPTALSHNDCVVAAQPVQNLLRLFAKQVNNELNECFEPFDALRRRMVQEIESVALVHLVDALEGTPKAPKSLQECKAMFDTKEVGLLRAPNRSGSQLFHVASTFNSSHDDNTMQKRGPLQRAYVVMVNVNAAGYDFKFDVFAGGHDAWDLFASDKLRFGSPLGHSELHIITGRSVVLDASMPFRGHASMMRNTAPTLNCAVVARVLLVPRTDRNNHSALALLHGMHSIVAMQNDKQFTHSKRSCKEVHEFFSFTDSGSVSSATENDSDHNRGGNDVTPVKESGLVSDAVSPTLASPIAVGRKRCSMNGQRYDTPPLAKVPRNCGVKTDGAKRRFQNAPRASKLHF